MIEFEKLRPQVEEILNGTQWVQWIHVPGGMLHCNACLGLNGCCFVQNKAPFVGEDNHLRCHCYYKSIPPITATAEADITKFTEYAFVWRPHNDKSGFFRKMGYVIEDSKWLQQEYMRQAKIKYENGEYELKGGPDEQGQRINIQIELFDRNNFVIREFYSGWLVASNGKIRLITPVGKVPIAK